MFWSRTARGMTATATMTATSSAAVTTAAATIATGTTATTAASVTPRRYVRSHDLGQHVACHRSDRKFAADVCLDVRQGNHVLLAAETDGVTFGARARRATDSMHVIF